MYSEEVEKSSQPISETVADPMEGVQGSEGLVFKVNNEERRISPEHLSKWRLVLPDLQIAAASQGNGGAHSERVIPLPDCSVEDFEVVRMVVEGSRWQNLSVPQWVTVLRLATQGKSHALRNTAIAHLDIALKTDHLQKLALGLEHKVSAWIIGSSAVLAQPGVELDLQKLASQLGWKTTARIAEAARFTSELSKLKPVVVPTTTLRCKCDNRLSYSLVPRTVEGNDIPSYHASSTMIVAWKPRKPEPKDDYYTGWGSLRDPGEWVCGQCVGERESYSNAFYTSLEIPLEMVLSDLIPDFNVDNREIVRRVFAEELKDAY